MVDKCRINIIFKLIEPRKPLIEVSLAGTFLYTENMTIYNRRATTITEQIQILKDRNLVSENNEFAKKYFLKLGTLDLKATVYHITKEKIGFVEKYNSSMYIIIVKTIH